MDAPISRKQEKVCVKCGNPWNSWGLKRDKCLQCDPIPPRLAALYRRQIDKDHEWVRL